MTFNFRCIVCVLALFTFISIGCGSDSDSDNMDSGNPPSSEAPPDDETFPNREDVMPGVIENNYGMTFSPIPAGTFMMGSPDDEPGRSDNEALHEVTLTQPFYMQTTEVTQGQWKAVMGEDDNPSFFNACGDDCPVENVSWYMAQEFIETLNTMTDDGEYRLPTEAEWEYAARGGSDTAFANGEITEFDSENSHECMYDANLDELGWYYCNSERNTHPVQKKLQNRYGLYDMHGNVSEWCLDWYGAYPTNPVRDPEGPDAGSLGVLRGGSWFADASDCRSAARLADGLDFRISHYGFRLVLLRHE